MLFSLVLIIACGQSPTPNILAADAATSTAPHTDPRSLSLTTLGGETLEKGVLEGKVVLFVNVASQCGFTKQYAGLQSLYAEYKDQGLVVVGTPCNQFGGQEPGEPEEIISFCRMNFGVEFPLLEKQAVNGPGRSELYSNLVSSSVGEAKDIRWNFEKFLVGRDGRVLNHFGSATSPGSRELVKAIKSAL